TLTVGKMSVATEDGGVQISSQWNRSTELRRAFWRVVAAAESNSEHPIGKAIALEGKNQLGLLDSDQSTIEEKGIGAIVTEFSAIVGSGIQCIVTPTTTFHPQPFQV